LEVRDPPEVFRITQIVDVVKRISFKVGLVPANPRIHRMYGFDCHAIVVV
jgi:hypothetical protein